MPFTYKANRRRALNLGPDTISDVSFTTGGSPRKRLNVSERKHRQRLIEARYKAHILEAAKTKAKTKKLLAQRNVFVGNFVPGTTEGDLWQLFNPCGTIKYLSIVCIGGLLMPKFRVHPEYYEGYRVEQYAEIRFTKACYADRAVGLNGLSWHGRTLARCRSLDDPWMYLISGARSRDLQQHPLDETVLGGTIALHPIGQRLSHHSVATRPLGPQPTEIIEDNSDGNNVSYHRKHGYSAGRLEPDSVQTDDRVLRVFGIPLPKKMLELVKGFPW
ncbi:hypothetical protein CONPUDRAFT_75393 [Coniophora puteana RWD-64-598 SS2]|uniref:RRM domain-containing protein n=1 Tax=Coniophora puteana (strain RWD-64-598) TaxID=741705 RepID=A0A5M3MF33_CONPW|nr:uncharacterized protein CONPUDRAFT_75393 [Coniophora puteana RWD-64-598 SS2]EIW77530.1 hypothetical protein CONPUDRAFT_75393 [Coniophora puteana RWD-64-598 SS2]